MPQLERPYEKFKEYGAEVLSEAELLAIIIKSGTKNSTSVEVAQKILKLASLEGLYDFSLKQLQEVEGIGEVKAIQIKAVSEFSKRMAKRKAKAKIQVNTPEKIAEIYMEEMRYLKQENFKTVYLDTKNNITGDKLITIGTINSTLVQPREVFSEAVKNKAANIIVLHNHPSGDSSPSREDRLTTQRLEEAGKILGINLLDHIIIGDGEYFSFKEEGII